MTSRMPPSARKTEASIPDQIRDASVKQQLVLGYLSATQEAFLDGDGDNPPFPCELLTAAAVTTKGLEDDVWRLHEHFAAGYIDLCQASQLVESPRHWGWNPANYYAPSFHLAAYFYSANAIKAIKKILAYQFPKEPDYDQFAFCWNEHLVELRQWSKGIGTEDYKATPLLGLERVAALRNCDRIPGSAFGPEILRPVTEWSEPRTPGDWAKSFGMSLPSLKKLMKSGSVRVEKMSRNYWRVAKADDPRASSD